MGNIEEELKELKDLQINLLSLEEIQKRINKASKQKNKALAVIKPKLDIIDALTERLKKATTVQEKERILFQLIHEEETLHKYGVEFKNACLSLNYYCNLKKTKQEVQENEKE